MLRKNLHRGVAAVVLMLLLAFAGAQPAAAEGLDLGRFWDLLSRFWGGLTVAGEADGPSQELSPLPAPSEDPTGQGDCGPEIDPNGCPRTQTGASANG